MFLRERVLDEIYMTVAPLVLGGKDAPSPVDGAAFPPENAPRLRLVSAEPIGDEVYLHYRVV
jgi:5-amino-6-(5-phosphoribosylamino)uracil reductase